MFSIKKLLFIQLLFSIFTVQAAPDYSSLIYYWYSGSGVLPEQSKQALKGTNERVYAIRLPVPDKDTEYRFTARAENDRILIPDIVFLNADLQEIKNTDAHSAVDACDGELQYQGLLPEEARYMIVRPWREGKKLTSLCWTIPLAEFPVPLPYPGKVTSAGDSLSAPEFSLFTAWNGRRRLFTSLELESDGHSILEESSLNRPQTPGALNLYLGADFPWQQRTFIRLKGGLRIPSVNRHKGQMLYLGAGYWVNRDWNLSAGLQLDINRNQVYFSRGYPAPGVVEYEPALGLRLAGEYHLSAYWNAELAVNLMQLETTDGTRTPANTVSASLTYFFN
ncbi:hypothetical protein ACQUQU_04985 [Thalassolituus sp. LLYu03]|uniref:hypothetical protein n=1 Tax=Thalassolituus sp. LLYu03 TaxID=3421656 RepID=UPI003D2DB321